MWFSTSRERSSIAYEPLITDRNSISKEEFAELPELKNNSSSYRRAGISFLILFVGVILGLVAARISRNNATNLRPTSLVYSPAQSALRYQSLRFNGSFGTHLTEYQVEPSEALDEKWHDLFRYGISRIPASEAEKLLHKTVPIPGDEEHYIVSLDVFHQLHCLNVIRKQLYPDYYTPEPTVHVDHCVDMLRQALSCNVDITPIPWKWSRSEQATLPVMDGTHQCVDFENIQKWAYDNRMTADFDETVNLELKRHMI
ncbi:hypothetical protein BT96DRAFT_862126 [Gymnopus androsaceus JB14]|uniref:Tat pathway signal sequence n=1 Tax=Gymnopus androsaceus JB14 TaxID=1447944 RepID=A0A6A4HBF8_9AGAR|nr:hypothetical protein BT96DRAFT_862126 [Gymnopus androsaceus JB14]